MAAIHSVLLRVTSEEWFITLVTFITPPAKARAKSLELQRRHIELN